MKSAQPNIYHIVFDGFTSLVFLRALKDLNTAETFNGFTFFQNNRANYNDTVASLPSLSTGSFYQKGPFRHWKNRKFCSGIFMEMHKNGYQLNLYTQNKKDSFENAAIKKFYADLLNHYTPHAPNALKTLKFFTYFADGCLSERMGKGTRLVLSNCMKPFKIRLNSTNGFPSFSVDRFLLSENILALPMMLEFILNEKTNPASGQYNFAHLMLPHLPVNWTRSFTAADNSSYLEQVYCAINLMGLLINELKRLDRFDDSLIIFHSDHGWSGVDFDYPCMQEIPEPVIDKIQRTTHHCPSRFFHRSHSLLLIKPPGPESLRPLEISDRLTQLADIPATISHLTARNARWPVGQPVFSDDWEFNRDVHLFAGLHRHNKLGLKCDFGTHFLKGRLAHVSLNPDNEWKIYPDLPISWN
ncbi:MAG: hypothetical protein C4518_17315 [Desulfobacteraceae bacterium]|nr:MAG: hypothetical protein C4518_17315 [Desulfobacteraceae bacterium]